MAIPYLHSKLVVDGHHTSAPKQRAGDSITEYTVKWVTFLYTQGSFGHVYSDRCFIELYLQVPPNKPVYPTLTLVHIATNIQGYA
jgi:hypothetical protein